MCPLTSFYVDNVTDDSLLTVGEVDTLGLGELLVGEHHLYPIESNMCRPSPFIVNAPFVTHEENCDLLPSSHLPIRHSPHL